MPLLTHVSKRRLLRFPIIHSAPHLPSFPPCPLLSPPPLAFRPSPSARPGPVYAFNLVFQGLKFLVFVVCFGFA